MIQILEAIEYLDSRRIPISGTGRRRLVVEVASNRRIDMAIVTPQQFREFQDASEYHELSFEWVEGLRAHDFYVDLPSDSPLSLLVWNSNEDKEAVVAYKISELPSPTTADVQAGAVLVGSV